VAMVQQPVAPPAVQPGPFSSWGVQQPSAQQPAGAYLSSHPHLAASGPVAGSSFRPFATPPPPMVFSGPPAQLAPPPTGFPQPVMPHQGMVAPMIAPVSALHTVLSGLLANTELCSEFRSNSLVPLPLVRWLQTFPHAFVELAYFLPVNAAKASKVEFSHQSGGPTNTHMAQLMPDPQRDQMRYFSTYLPSLQLVPITTFAEWKVAMERYIECLRRVDVISGHGVLPAGMRRHAANVEMIHANTQGASTSAEPFRGIPFWSYYDIQRRSDLFNDPGSGNWPSLDNSLVATITLAYGAAGHLANPPVSTPNPSVTSSSSNKRAEQGSSASTHPSKKGGGASSVASVTAASQHSDDHCFYFNGISGCRFSATACRKSHRCMRCNSTDHGAATHT